MAQLVRSLNLFSDIASSLPKALTVALIQLAILSAGWAISTADYTESDFASRHIVTLLIVTVFLAAVSFLMNDPGEIGLRKPTMSARPMWTIPAVLTTLMVAAHFAVAWATLPEDASVDGATTAGTFATTIMVGITEEWTYRGLLLVVLAKVFGLRRGLLWSSVGFGLLHAINPIAGQSASSTVSQVALTGVLSGIFILAAVGTRSIWPAMVLHGLYDFFLIGSSQFVDAGGDKSVLPSVATLIAVVGAVYGFVRVARSGITRPFLDDPRTPSGCPRPPGSHDLGRFA